MTIAPWSLQPLDPEYISQLYRRAEADEPIFRNILVDLADDAEEVDLFKRAPLDRIFDQYVRVSGSTVTRVRDFRVGPFNEAQGYGVFDNFDPARLEQDKALIYIERSNDSWVHLYKVLADSSVKHTKRLSHYQL